MIEVRGLGPWLLWLVKLWALRIALTVLGLAAGRWQLAWDAFSGADDAQVLRHR